MELLTTNIPLIISDKNNNKTYLLNIKMEYVQSIIVNGIANKIKIIRK
jgi:hypothetical protein